MRRLPPLHYRPINVPSFRAYADVGWALCALPHGEKAPKYARWNTEPLKADACDELPGAGLLHALSGTCALDVDDANLARAWLAERGIELDALLEADNAVGISSGTPNRTKLLFRMRRPLTTLKPARSGLELRCATAQGTSVHDALPGSTHPSGRRYEWAGGILGDWRALPPIPASLLALWRGLLADEPAGQQLDRVDASTPRVDLQRLRKATFQHSPDAEYDEWLRVGMQLHEGTGGAQEGLDIWCEWSRGITRAKYPGDDKLKQHYVSFRTSGRHVATGEALVSELPAEAEDFEIIPPWQMDDDELAEQKQKLARKIAETTKEAAEKLEAQLVYVYGSERYFDLQRRTIIGSDNALEHIYTSQMPKGKKGVRLNPVKVLKESSTKRFVDGIGFHPGEGAIFRDATMDRTFANNYLDRRPAPVEPTAEERACIEWLFDRIDDEMFREWLRQFFGHVVQRPGVKINSAPLIWSEIQGNGKTTLLRVIPSKLVGPNYSQEVSCSLLESGFNDYLVNAWHVNLAEFRAGTRGERESISEKLKSWIADQAVSIHPKGSRAYTMPNHFFVTATSNKDDAASIDNNDRRWAVHELHAPQFTPEEQERIYGFLNGARAPAVLRHYFLNVSLDDFVASATAPYTEAKADMVSMSTAGDFEMLLDAFEQRKGPFEKDVVLTSDVTEFVRKHSRFNPSANRIGKMLRREPFNGKSMVFRVRDRTYRAIVLRGAWLIAQGIDIMKHIQSDDIDLTA